MTLHELQQRRAKLSDEMRALHKEIGDNKATDEQRSQWDTKNKELVDLDQQILEEERLRAEDQRFVERHHDQHSGGQWVDKATGREIPVYRSTDRISPEQKPADEITMGQYLRALATGAKTDAEHRALDSTINASGGYTVPVTILGRWIDRMRAQNRAIQAGAQTIMLTTPETCIVRLESDPVAVWRVENSAVNESGPTFGRIEFSAKSLAVLVKTSKELLRDSLNVESMLESSLAAAMAAELDRAVLYGNGGIEGKTEPIGIANTSGILTLSEQRTNAYRPILSACRSLALENANAPSAAIMSPSDAFYFAAQVDANGQPLNKPPIVSTLPLLDTTKATDNQIIIGDYPRLLIGIRQAMEVQILVERFAENLQVGYLCSLRADCAVEQPKSFCKLTLPDSAEWTSAVPMSIPDHGQGKGSAADQLVEASRK